MSVIIFLIVLAVLILVHEFGHFIVAKKSGIRVDEFGLGFPPKIISKKFGSTLYTLNAIPFGGFVKIFGEDPHAENISEADKPTSFFYKPKWVQSLVLVAGVTFNIIFAWLLISLGLFIGMPAGPDYSGFGQVSNVELTVTQVIADLPAHKAGLISGDEILKVTLGNTVLQDDSLTPESVSSLISTSNKPLDFVYSRGDEEKKVSILPILNEESGKNMVGIAMDEIGILKLPPHLALLEGARTTGLMIEQTAIGLAVFLWDTVKLNSDFSQVTGPVGIAGVVGEAKTLGFVYLLSITALISINLAIINLLPFPALDGGRLFFILIEVITRRKIPDSFVRWTNLVGFILLLLLMLVVTGNDILKLL